MWGCGVLQEVSGVRAMLRAKRGRRPGTCAGCGCARRPRPLAPPLPSPHRAPARLVGRLRTPKAPCKVLGEVGSRNPSALLVAWRRRTAIRSKRRVSWGRSLPPVAARCASLLHYSRSDCWGWRQAPAPTGRVPWAGRTGPKCPAVVARRAWSEHNQPPAPQPLPKVPARSAQRLPSGRLCMRFCILPERLRPSGQRPVLTGRAGLLPHVQSVRLVGFSALVRRANARQRGATAPWCAAGQGMPGARCIPPASDRFFGLIFSLRRTKVNYSSGDKKQHSKGMSREVCVNSHLRFTWLGKLRPEIKSSPLA